MLKIYDIVIEMIAEMRPAIDKIARRDADLARQLRGAPSSVALYIAEGSGVRAGARRLRYETALGSMREAIACIDVARALGYVSTVDNKLTAKQDHIIGTLFACFIDNPSSPSPEKERGPVVNRCIA